MPSLPAGPHRVRARALPGRLEAGQVKPGTAAFWLGLMALVAYLVTIGVQH